MKDVDYGKFKLIGHFIDALTEMIYQLMIQWKS